jgi:acetyl esterase/lipase
MEMQMRKLLFIALVALMSLPARAQQLSPEARWITQVASEYEFHPNIVYKRASQFDCKLDVVCAADKAHPRPTLIYIHGGGWTGGSKESASLRTFPYIAAGMNVVNVEYRLASVALAPAAVEDCRCALHWVYQHSKDYGFDLDHLVLNGHSAGGHLSLMTGMLTPDAGFDNECPGKENLRVAAIVNYYGITDVADLLAGPNQKTYAVEWLASLRDRFELAKQLSPLTYVRAGLPPIFTAQGDADPTVPYQHSVCLHKALTEAGVPNQLYTVPGGKHGGWTTEQNLKVQEAIFTFLKQYGVLGR